MTFIASIRGNRDEAFSDRLATVTQHIRGAFPGKVRIQTLPKLGALILDFEAGVVKGDIREQLLRIPGVGEVAEDFGVAVAPTDASLSGHR